MSLYSCLANHPYCQELLVGGFNHFHCFPQRLGWLLTSYNCRAGYSLMVQSGRSRVINHDLDGEFKHVLITAWVNPCSAIPLGISRQKVGGNAAAQVLVD